MENKEKLLKSIEKSLSTMFVEDYNKVNDAKESINEYFKDLNMDYQYNYNDFCSDFMKNSKIFISKLSLEELNNFNAGLFVFDILSFMIKNKINEISKDDNTKLDLMMKHELKKYLFEK